MKNFFVNFFELFCVMVIICGIIALGFCPLVFVIAFDNWLFGMLFFITLPLVGAIILLIKESC